MNDVVVSKLLQERLNHVHGFHHFWRLLFIGHISVVFFEIESSSYRSSYRKCMVRVVRNHKVLSYEIALNSFSDFNQTSVAAHDYYMFDLFFVLTL